MESAPESAATETGANHNATWSIATWLIYRIHGNFIRKWLRSARPRRHAALARAESSDLGSVQRPIIRRLREVLDAADSVCGQDMPH